MHLEIIQIKWEKQNTDKPLYNLIKKVFKDCYGKKRLILFEISTYKVDRYKIHV